jgi:hypothetical protein
MKLQRQWHDGSACRRKLQLVLSLLWCGQVRLRHALVHCFLNDMPGIFYHALLVEVSMLADMSGMAIAK